MKVLQVINCRDWAIDNLFKMIEGDIDRIYSDDWIGGTKSKEFQKIRLSQYDVVHFGVWYDYVDIDVPAIITVHHIEPEHEAEVMRVLKTAKATIVAVCEQTAELVRSYGIECLTVPNTVSDYAPRIGYLGRDVPTKRFDWIKSAIKACGYIDAGIIHRDLEHLKSPEELEKWYRSLNVFVSASSVEGGPLPALEAHRFGTPVLATKTGVFYEYFKNKPEMFFETYEELVEKLKAIKPFLTQKQYSDKWQAIYEQSQH